MTPESDTREHTREHSMIATQRALREQAEITPRTRWAHPGHTQESTLYCPIDITLESSVEGTQKGLGDHLENMPKDNILLYQLSQKGLYYWTKPRGPEAITTSVPGIGERWLQPSWNAVSGRTRTLRKYFS